MTPRAGVDAIDGVDDEGRLKVRVRAAPTDGAANKAMLRVVADAIDVAPSVVSIVYGAGSRIKLVEVDGVAATVPMRLWKGLRIKS